MDATKNKDREQLITAASTAEQIVGELARQIAKSMQADCVDIADAAMSLQFLLLETRRAVRESIEHLRTAEVRR